MNNVIYERELWHKANHNRWRVCVTKEVNIYCVFVEAWSTLGEEVGKPELVIHVPVLQSKASEICLELACYMFKDKRALQGWEVM
jgi:hypothetical protein